MQVKPVHLQNLQKSVIFMRKVDHPTLINDPIFQPSDICFVSFSF